jgi:hypothetical protein
VRLLAVLAAIAAAAALAPAAVAAARPDLSRLWHSYPLGQARLQTTPSGPLATGGARATAAAPRKAAHGDDGRTDAVLASIAAALTVLAVVALGRRIRWAVPGNRGQIILFAAAAVIGIVVGMLIPLIS